MLPLCGPAAALLLPGVPGGDGPSRRAGERAIGTDPDPGPAA